MGSSVTALQPDGCSPSSSRTPPTPVRSRASPRSSPVHFIRVADHRRHGAAAGEQRNRPARRRHHDPAAAAGRGQESRQHRTAHRHHPARGRGRLLLRAISDGTARCWGSNGTGQLGDGTMTQRLLPVTVRNTAGTATAHRRHPDRHPWQPLVCADEPTRRPAAGATTPTGSSVTARRRNGCCRLSSRTPPAPARSPASPRSPPAPRTPARG